MSRDGQRQLDKNRCSQRSESRETSRARVSCTRDAKGRERTARVRADCDRDSGSEASPERRERCVACGYASK